MIGSHFERRMKQQEKIKEIKTTEEFVSFVNNLSKDFHDNPKSWENNNLGAFLEALAAWVEDMEGYYVIAPSPKGEGF